MIPWTLAGFCAVVALVALRLAHRERQRRRRAEHDLHEALTVIGCLGSSLDLEHRRAHLAPLLLAQERRLRTGRR